MLFVSMLFVSMLFVSIPISRFSVEQSRRCSGYEAAGQKPSDGCQTRSGASTASPPDASLSWRRQRSHSGAYAQQGAAEQIAFNVPTAYKIADERGREEGAGQRLSGEWILETPSRAQKAQRRIARPRPFCRFTGERRGGRAGQAET